MKNVSAAIIRKGDQILITRRAPGVNLEGYWEFPGGKQEEGESIQECLVRELAEELDIAVEAQDVLIESVYIYAGGAIRLIGLKAEIVSGDITLSVHDAFTWVNRTELLDYKLAPADIPIAEWIIESYED